MPAKEVLMVHKFVLASYFALLALLTLNIVWLNPPEKFPIALLLIFNVGPLLVPLKGILSGKNKSHLYMSFISLFYFAHAIVKVYGQLELWISLLQLITSLSLFMGCLVFTHKQLKTR